MTATSDRDPRRTAFRLVIALVVAGLAHGPVGSAALATGKPSTTRKPDASYEIEVRPERVYPSIVYTLRLVTIDADAADADAGERYWSWSASRGEILSDGQSEIHWKSPAATGRVTLRAVEIGPEGTPTRRRAEIEVDVCEPSRDGMVLVPAGTFVMGDSWTDAEDPFFVPTFQNMTDKPPHRVYLDAYWIDRNRVTNRQYAAYLQDALRQGIVRVTPEAVLGMHEGIETPFYYFEIGRPNLQSGVVPPLAEAIRWREGRFEIRRGLEEHPVLDVTWAGAFEYARFHGRRLPTEAEWEKAARGVGLERFPWGDELPTKYHANLGAPRREEIAPVGSFSPTGDSPYGVADILGGMEWVDDWFGRFYYRDNYSALPIENPRGPEWGDDRVVRGVPRRSKFLGDGGYLAPLGFRYQWVFEFGHGLVFAHDDTGFRTALPATKEEAERAGDTGRRRDLPLRPREKFPLPRRGYSY